MSSNTVYIALGANLGDPIDALLSAVDHLRPLALKGQIDLSNFYRTAPIESSGPDYINAVARFQIAMPALGLLHALQEIENQAGRVRSVKNAPRTLDLDLLLYGQETHHTEELTVPHPRMHLRAFVLRPLLDLAPTMVLAQGPANELLAQLADQQIQPLGLENADD